MSFFLTVICRKSICFVKVGIGSTVFKTINNYIYPFDYGFFFFKHLNTFCCILMILYFWQMTTAIAIEDVRREVKILRALTGHKNLVQFYDAYEDDENVYVVMEYV